MPSIKSSSWFKSTMREQALSFLRETLGLPDADFRPGQWESIEALLNLKKLLVVQRTGWGKSMVYFLATRLLRDRGAGVTLLISPLLSLMRNQLEAASQLNLNAVTINSTNQSDWDDVERRLAANDVDVLLISPERLGNDKFRANVLSSLSSNVGLFVVDEAHCISDWGHDFRPDYLRIVRIIESLPSNVPVLATTATANDRVVADVVSQLGDIELQRGPLMRESLKLQNIEMLSPSARLAWMADNIPKFAGSGIVYTLTKRDASRVAQWLKLKGIDAEAYHADVKSEEESSRREALEQKLINNELKVLVATVALGMGFDKPDIGFVIHYQRPSSVVHYYQQVGRAGRAIDQAFGILLHGEEDDQIANFFIRSAFPPQSRVAAILEALLESDDGLSVPQLQSHLNLKKSQIEDAIKVLSVESPSPLTKLGSKYVATAHARDYKFNEELVSSITDIRHAEQRQMQDYMNYTGCLMEFLGRALDDPLSQPCGKCSGCVSGPLVSPAFSDELANEAGLFLRRNYQTLIPRKRWPPYNALASHGLTGNINESLPVSEGRALCLWGDAGWGELVVSGKYSTQRFDDSLVAACEAMIKQWSPDPAPTWVTSVPSLNNPTIVPDFAKRLADSLGIPFMDCVTKIRNTRPQKEMQNSFQQAKNLEDAFEVTLDVGSYGPCLLIDDMVDSRWTFAVVGALLRQKGCEVVFPVALALTSPSLG